MDGPPASRTIGVGDALGTAPDGFGAAIESRHLAGSGVHFVWAFVGVVMMLGAWTFATPIGAAPDEPAHTAQAVAIVRGQFDEPEVRVTKTDSIAFVRVPCWVDSPWLRRLGCGGKVHATAGFAVTEFSNAPPLYYVVVGIPSLLLSGTAGIYAMRVTGDVLNAALIALGIWLLLRYYPRRTPLIGVLLALSPMALFLMSVLNSSGLEIAAGFAAWCGLLCVVAHPNVPRPLALWTAVASILLVLSRPVSPVDLLVIVIVLAVFVGWRDLHNRLNPSLRPLWIPVAVSVAVAAVFILVDGQPSLLGSPPAHGASLISNIATTLHLTGGYLEQSIGNFGWLDVPAPTWVVVDWTVCLALVTIAAFVLSARCRRSLSVLALAALAMTLALEAPQMNTVGNYFQGRYILPVLIGFPLVATCFEWQGKRLISEQILARTALVLGIALFVGQVGAFDQALHIYRTGRVTHGAWLPPGGQFAVQVVFVVGAILTFALVVVNASRPTEVRYQPSTVPISAVSE